MKLKNLIIAGALALMLPASLCSAADVSVSVDWETTNVTVKASLGGDFAGKKLMMCGLAEGKSLSDIEEADTTQSVRDDFAAVKYAQADENGDAEFPQFKVAGKNGNYCFYVTAYSSNEVFKSDAVYISTKESFDDFVASLCNKSASEIRDILDSEVENKYVNINIPIYEDLNDEAKDAAAAALADREYSSITEAMEEINKASVKPGLENAEEALALAKLIYPEKYSDTEEFASMINAESGMSQTKKLSTFKVLDKMSDSEILAILEEAVKNENNEDTVDSINIAIINKLFSECTGHGDVFYVIKNHKDDAMPTWEGYGSYSVSTNRNAVNKTLLTMVFGSTKELTDYITDYINNPPSSGSGSGSGNGGGNKGGGNKGGSSSSTAAIPTLVTGQTSAEPREENIKVEMKHNFADMASFSWADEAVAYLKNKGVIAGKTNVTFEPSANVTREEFIKMIVAAFEIHNDAAKSDFADVADGAWYESFIASAVEKGIVNGVSETEFGVGSLISRQDMAVMVARAKGANLSDATVTGFADDAQVADYAKAAVKWMKDKGFVSGYADGTFAPGNFCTRAEAAKIIYEAIK